MRFAVVGGGITGLAAAWQLATERPDAEVTVFEPYRLGGKILTEELAGRRVDCGPDAFITRVPDAAQLCLEIGVAGELVAPAAGRAQLWYRGRLRDLPDGLVLGVPGRLSSLLAARILSPRGLARAAADLFLPAGEWRGDVSVADLVGRRFGPEVVDRLVDPLLGGIHAGSTRRLSAEATTPQLVEVARSERSLLLGLRGFARPGTGRRLSPAPGAVFSAPRGGMGRLVECLADALDSKRVKVVRSPVTAVRAGAAGRGLFVEPGGHFDGAVLAVPAGDAARVIGEASPRVVVELAAIRFASVAIVTLVYPAEAARLSEGTSGFLVPRTENRLLTACSFGSAKWPHWSARGNVVLRASVGRDGEDGAQRLDDSALVDRVHAELGEALGVRAEPVAWRVHRWPMSFPQYDVGHLGRVARIEALMAGDLPHAAVAGSSYHGSGIPACIGSGRRAASAIIAGA
ncbi:MAG: protoporphyrinogen oxidase [Acidimicrobiales bacterium]